MYEVWEAGFGAYIEWRKMQVTKTVMKKETRVTRRKMLESKELWLEIFSMCLEKMIDPEHMRPEGEIVEDAADVANAALDKVEERWPE